MFASLSSRVGCYALSLVTGFGVVLGARSALACESDSECKGDRVCVNGQCSAPAEAERPAGAYEPAYVQSPADDGQRDDDADPVESQALNAALPRFSVVLHAGPLVLGSGEQRASCDGADCNQTQIDQGNENNTYAHKTSWMLGADFLWRVGSKIRLGPGIQLGTTSTIAPEWTNKDLELGTDVSLNFVLEAMFPVGHAAWIGPRGQVGLMELLPSGELKDSMQTMKRECQAAGISGCDNFDGPRVGFELGIGMGAVFALSHAVRLRADVMVQPYVINLYALEAKSGYDATLSVNLLGVRSYLLGGIEF